MPITEKQLAIEVRAIFKIIGICLILTLIGCAYLYYTTDIPFLSVDHFNGQIDRDADRAIYRRVPVKHNWSKILIWSLIIIIGGRYLIRLFNWSKKNAA